MVCLEKGGSQTHLCKSWSRDNCCIHMAKHSNQSHKILSSGLLLCYYRCIPGYFAICIINAPIMSQMCQPHLSNPMQQLIQHFKAGSLTARSVWLFYNLFLDNSHIDISILVDKTFLTEILAHSPKDRGLAKYVDNSDKTTIQTRVLTLPCIAKCVVRWVWILAD